MVKAGVDILKMIYGRLNYSFQHQHGVRWEEDVTDVETGANDAIELETGQTLATLMEYFPILEVPYTQDQSICMCSARFNQLFCSNSYIFILLEIKTRQQKIFYRPKL